MKKIKGKVIIFIVILVVVGVVYTYYTLRSPRGLYLKPWEIQTIYIQNSYTRQFDVLEGDESTKKQPAVMEVKDLKTKLAILQFLHRDLNIARFMNVNTDFPLGGPLVPAPNILIETNKRLYVVSFIYAWKLNDSKIPNARLYRLEKDELYLSMNRSISIDSTRHNRWENEWLCAPLPTDYHAMVEILEEVTGEAVLLEDYYFSQINKRRRVFPDPNGHKPVTITEG